MANKQISPDTWDEYEQSNSDDVEKIPNKERGCGWLKAGGSYIRSDIDSDADGTLPGFVIMMDEEGNLDPIPYKESLPRGYETLNGSNFMAAAETIRTFAPLYPGDADAEESHQEAHEGALENMVEVGAYASKDQIPDSELARHLDRMAINGISGEHWGEITPANSKDLMMRVGKSYYESPWDFIDETLELGLNKGISVHSNKRPPTIHPGRTRVWLIHPHACGEDMPGVFGFVYLTRTIFTRDKDRNVPSYAQEYAESGQMDIVGIGQPEALEDDDERDYEDIADSTSSLDEFDLDNSERERGMDPQRLQDAPETVSSESSGSLEDGVQQALDAGEDVLAPQQIDEMEKADLADLSEQNWEQAQAPPEELDAVHGDGGLLGIIDGRKVSASNNFSWDPEEQHGSSVVGPYTVEVREQNGKRMIHVDK